MHADGINPVSGKYNNWWICFSLDFRNGTENGDDRLDSDDAIYLLRHTLNPERYPLPP